MIRTNDILILDQCCLRLEIVSECHSVKATDLLSLIQVRIQGINRPQCSTCKVYLLSRTRIRGKEESSTLWVGFFHKQIEGLQKFSLDFRLHGLSSHQGCQHLCHLKHLGADILHDDSLESGALFSVRDLLIKLPFVGPLVWSEVFEPVRNRSLSQEII